MNQIDLLLDEVIFEKHSNGDSQYKLNQETQ